MIDSIFGAVITGLLFGIFIGALWIRPGRSGFPEYKHMPPPPRLTSDQEKIDHADKLIKCLKRELEKSEQHHKFICHVLGLKKKDGVQYKKKIEKKLQAHRDNLRKQLNRH